jgi:hypothetical protein
MSFAFATTADANATVTVSSVPNVPVVPSDGWAVAYADGFGAALGAVAGDDNTLYPNRSDACSNAIPYNSDEMEVFNCSATSVTASGLALACSYTPSVGTYFGQTQNYTCGAAQGAMTVPGSSPSGYVSPPGYDFFSWRPGEGQTWAVEVKAQFPPNSGEADPGWWADGPPWNAEIDFFEGFGLQAGAGGTWCTAGPGSNGHIGTTLPTWVYDRSPYQSIGAESDLCHTEGFDPSAAIHTYTTVFYPDNTLAEYIDGQLAKWDWVPNGGPAYASSGGNLIGPAHPGDDWMGLILSYALRNDATGNPDHWFQSGTRMMLVRSVAVYENAGANFANTINHGIAPGSNVSPPMGSGGSTCRQSHKACKGGASARIRR